MKIGFIGFGEAAFHISKGLIKEGIDRIAAFDINLEHPKLGATIQKRAVDSQVSLVSSLKELSEKSTIIISANSAKCAVQIAKECAGFLNSSHYYVDINSTSPDAKKEIASCLKKNKAIFVDAAVMGSIPQYGHKVPILLSGEGAQKFCEIGKSLGMDLSVINAEAGSASAIKMTRSVFIKGFTMLLIEALQVSCKFEIEDYILKSIEDTIQSSHLEKIANGLITRTAIHAERRVTEMDEVINTLQSVEVEPIMSLATKKALQSIVNKDLRAHFNYQQPSKYNEVIRAINNKE